MRLAIMTLGVFFLLPLIGCSDQSDEETWACSRPVDAQGRLETARALVSVTASNYESLARYWAEDVTYREPVLTSHGRDEVIEYFRAMFSGSKYGFPMDRDVEIRNELQNIEADDSMTYMATLQWTGSFADEFFFQTGMSILKFRPGEGCPYYHRDYYSEGDTWWNIPEFKSDISTFREVYITFFGLSGRCFDDDGDGYSKYASALGCPEEGIDCNDFLPNVHPGALEIVDNGIDEDCDALTPMNTLDAALQAYQ